jgi:hypothetical protein
MPAPRKGVVPLSPARKIVCEMLRHAHRVPTLPQSYELNVAALADVRQRCSDPPSWLTIFMRAYGLAAQRRPELRRVYIPWPRPHLYEHPFNEAAVLIEREWQGETIVLAAKVQRPETTPLQQIAAAVREYTTAPVLSVSDFRQLLRLGRLPAPFRRFAFWQTLYLSGYKRCKRFGTFMISSLGNLGATQLHPIAPMTSYLTFGPIRPDGRVTVVVVYDHRVMDGRSVAHSVQELDRALHGEVLDELRGLSRAAA